ncbi:class I SAM-dependent methyltransferase [Solirubrobacter sp. CPCC 204708]|uniref:Class I SAM-dependent methyltransferase n=1 Tax=Solirubrobacter deserti TaxID=2282478 RepID=A0ABT4RHF5_9ACTN|nr:class I SAM-dependent methyltransferase [Solirubrobacter deserti]MBE2315294.1 class I SAM-dependent methyltransferase [Solirubrobacter deserti]MDA0137979.1 class I SAM-dependent methyltransferase [Solirubrobacter deserti]
MTISELAAWHDVECGRYEADLPLWKELAKESQHGVLDIGAGTGRVALRLAYAGVDVTALDLEPELLDVLTERAHEAGVTVPTVAADARSFTFERQFDLILVPMQTLQLLPTRFGFFDSVRRALHPGGRLAVAIVTQLETYDGQPPLPAPDIGHFGEYTYISQPVSVQVGPHSATIDRLRQRVAPDGERETTEDRIELAVVSPGTLAEEAAQHGLEADELRHIEETPEHVASEVVLFRG